MAEERRDREPNRTQAENLRNAAAERAEVFGGVIADEDKRDLVRDREALARRERNAGRQ